LALPQTGHGIFKKGMSSLTVQGVGRVMLQPVRQDQGHLAATFAYSSKAQRHAMICKLFSGRYTTVPLTSHSTRQLISSLWEKTFHG
jgi:cellulose synthase (UDP-forming)